MKRLSVIGLDEVRDHLLSDLIDIGIVEITEEKSQDEESQLLGNGSGSADSAKVAQLDQQIGDIELAIETLNEHRTDKKPLFTTRRDIRRQEFEFVLRDREDIEKDVQDVLKLRDGVHKVQERKNKDNADLLAIEPWKDYDIPLDVTKTRCLDIDLGIMPAAVEIDELRKEMDAITDLYMFDEIHRDKDFVYYTLVTMKEYTAELQDLIRQRGYTSVSFQGLHGKVPEIEQELKADIEKCDEAIENLRAQITELYPKKHRIECLHDDLMVVRDEERIKNRLQNTERTFRFEGWVPEPAEDAVATCLDRNECWYKMTEPEEEDPTPPVLLNNSQLTRPHEAIVEMYSLPEYHSYDPTNWVSLFYTIFFGMMLSDAGYGIVLTIVCGIVLHKFNLEGTVRKMWKTFFYGGISSIFWGALFGSWFGNLVDAFSGTFLGIKATLPAIWFNPIDDPTRLLIFSLAIGVVHLFIGMGINAGMLIKDGKWVDAVCDVFSWYAVITGGILWGVGAMVSSTPAAVGSIGKWVFIVGILMLLFTGGRKNKGIFGKIGGGLKSVYDITGYLSDILSYARLLALGMATSVIAQVMNTIGALPGRSVVGLIIFIVVFLLGHTLNMIINLLGAFVHSSRLQYLEFFGKFYVDGGDAFVPFRRDTKYIRITSNALQGGNIYDR